MTSRDSFFDDAMTDEQRATIAEAQRALITHFEPQRRLYLLRPVESTSWDSARGFVVAATSELQARAFAADRCGDEGPGVWTSSDRSTCQRIDDEVPPLGVVIRDFLNG